MSTLEKKVEDTIGGWCKENDVLWIKFSPMGSRGWPDRIAVFPGGFHLWIELKRKGKTPRKLQQHRMGELISKGALAVWFDDAEVCIDYMRDCLEAAKEAATEQGVVVASSPKIPYPH